MIVKQGTCVNMHGPWYPQARWKHVIVDGQKQVWWTQYGKTHYDIVDEFPPTPEPNYATM